VTVDDELVSSLLLMAEPPDDATCRGRPVTRSARMGELVAVPERSTGMEARTDVQLGHCASWKPMGPLSGDFEPQASAILSMPGGVVVCRGLVIRSSACRGRLCRRTLAGWSRRRARISFLWRPSSRSGFEFGDG